MGCTACRIECTPMYFWRDLTDLGSFNILSSLSILSQVVLLFLGDTSSEKLNLWVSERALGHRELEACLLDLLEDCSDVRP